MRHRTWLVTILLVGCLPPTGEDREHARSVARVRAPAKYGLVVEVRLEELLSQPGFSDLRGRSGDEAGVAVRFRGAPVGCRLHVGADGELGDDDLVTFTVQQQTPHSPFLVYQVVRLGREPGLRGPAPNQETCEVLRAGAVHEDVLARLVGKHRAAAGREPALASSEPLVDASTWARWGRVDYLVLGPRALLPGVEALVAHRERMGHVVATLAVEDVYDRMTGGNPDPAVLRSAVHTIDGHSGGRLKFLLLVGDVESGYRPDADALAPVPTFYEPKVAYDGHRSHKTYATDHPYGVLGRGERSGADPPARIAVGRLPVRTAAGAASFAAKVVAYETEGDARGKEDPAWRRRLLLFGGPANYGAVLDALIESQATWLLDSVLPYDYDLGVVFAKEDSPYAYRLDRLGDKMVEDMNKGALIAAYFGHGSPGAFDYVLFRDKVYPIGRADELERVRIGAGKPVFLSFTCHTGAYDLEGGEASLAEVLALAPDGPVAVFAASRASHPYPNALYAMGFIDLFLKKHPRTLGEGLLALKKRMRSDRFLLAETLVRQDTAELRREHEGLYNLLGDPGLRLRYARPLEVAVAPRSQAGYDRSSAENRGSIRPGADVVVTVRTAGVPSGEVLVTLETERHRLRGEGLVPYEKLRKMPRDLALGAMARNHALALDKVVEEKRVRVQDGIARVELLAPSEPGRYIVKALVEWDGAVAAGHGELHVGSAAPREAARQ